MADGLSNDDHTSLPGWLAMPGRGDALWTRVALVFTTLVTVGIAAAMLVMTVHNLGHRH